MNIGVYGEIGIDWLVDDGGAVVDRWGGSGLYAALTAAKLGATVELLTLTGPEINKNCFSVWQRLGVSNANVKFVEDYSIPRYLVTGFGNYETKVSRPMNELKTRYSFSPKLPQHSEGILIFPIGHSIPIELCREAYQKNIPVFLDPKPNQNSINDARKALQYTTILLANEEEILLLAGEDECFKAIEKLQGVGPHFAIVKKGVRGCMIFEDGCLVETIPAFRSDVKCTLGSGDVFGGAFAVAYLQKKDIKYCVEFASCVAANFIENFEIEVITPRRAAEIDMVQRERIIVGSDKITVYLAGPFFSDQELAWVNRIVCILERAGITVLSPSRDNGIIKSSDNQEMRREIFLQDIILLEKADLVVALLDHDDTGTSFEIGYAFKKNIPIIGFKTSITPLNNMLKFGCSIICNSIEQLIHEVYAYGKR